MMRVHHTDDDPDPCACGDCGATIDAPAQRWGTGLPPPWVRYVGCAGLVLIAATVLGLAWRAFAWAAWGG